jgi:hypothetical protein
VNNDDTVPYGNIKGAYLPVWPHADSVFGSFLLVWLMLETIYRATSLHVGMRGGLGQSLTAKRDHISGLENDKNLYYMVDVTLGGQPFQVLIDIGR